MDVRRASGIVFAILIGCNAAFGAGLKPGTIPPDYLGKTVSGESVQLASLRGDVVVISFWATWCHYCLKEIPILAGLQSIATQRGLHMQVVAVDYKEPSRTFSRAAHILMSRLPNLLLTWDRNGKIGKPYGVGGGIPVMVMLHRDGTVADVHIGYDKDKLDALIREINVLLNEPAIRSAAAAAP